MSVLILRALISGTAKTSGGLRVWLNPDSLARACAEQGLSFTKLASAAGLSRPTISLAARGGLTTPRSAFRIADALSRGLRAGVVSERKRYVDWELTDPAGKSLHEVRAIRDDIDSRVQALLAELVPSPIR